MLLLTKKANHQIKRKLKEIFGQTIFLPENPFLPPQIAFHTDLSCCRFQDALICSPSMYAFLSQFALPIPLIRGKKEPSEIYPNDIYYNAAAIGNFLFCREDFTEKEILVHAKETGMEIVNIRQGYAKCSIVKVSETALISADKNIQKAAMSCGLSCLPTDNSPVLLPGFPNGFLGGASICTDCTVFFIGDLTLHKDCEKIQNFCRENGKKTGWIRDMALYDLGSPIFLPEKICDKNENNKKKA